MLLDVDARRLVVYVDVGVRGGIVVLFDKRFLSCEVERPRATFSVNDVGG